MTSASRPVVIVGQGYVGLPVAMRAVEVGFDVVGIDVDHHRVESLRQGHSYVDDVSQETLKAAIASGRYRASTDYGDAAGFGTAIISVPTPLRDTLPDLSFIEASVRSIGAHVSSGAVVVLESTTYPGTTEELVVPILEEASGLVAGQDFFVGYSPERIDPGNPSWGFVQTPKVVSGINEASLKAVDEFFSRLIERTVPVSSPKEAELTKLLENTFRHVNIALVNELAVFANQLGVNIWEAIDAADTKPFGYMKFQPGPGVGGHCLPIDPSYLSWQVRRQLGQSFRFVELANNINDHMPQYVVQRAVEILNRQKKAANGSRVLLVGLAYKKNTGDCRESPALRIAELLNGVGSDVFATDPHVPDAKWPEGVTRVNLSRETLRSMDLVILNTDHDVFDFDLLEDASSSITGTPIFDTRNRLQGKQIDQL